MARTKKIKKWTKQNLRELVETSNRICALCGGHVSYMKGATMLRGNRTVIIHFPKCPSKIVPTG